MLDTEKIEKEIEELSQQGLKLFMSVYKLEPEGIA